MRKADGKDDTKKNAKKNAKDTRKDVEKDKEDRRRDEKQNKKDVEKDKEDRRRDEKQNKKADKQNDIDEGGRTKKDAKKDRKPTPLPRKAPTLPHRDTPPPPKVASRAPLKKNEPVINDGGAEKLATMKARLESEKAEMKAELECQRRSMASFDQTIKMWEGEANERQVQIQSMQLTKTQYEKSIAEGTKAYILKKTAIAEVQSIILQSALRGRPDSEDHSEEPSSDSREESSSKGTYYTDSESDEENE
jgi:hypothetical protein